MELSIVNSSLVALIDDCEIIQINYEWHLDERKLVYRLIGTDRSRCYLHDLIGKKAFGDGDGIIVHKTPDSLDNRLSNLLKVEVPAIQGTSTYKGVFRRKSQYFCFVKFVDGDYHERGPFETPLIAAKVYDSLIKELNLVAVKGLNFPDCEM